jgi:hypothetical protein
MAILRRVDAFYLSAGMLTLAAAAGPPLLIASDFFTLFEVRSLTAVIPEGAVSGGRNHAYVMVMIGVVAAPMAWGAIRGASRPAMVALAVLGVVAAFIALGNDLPDATGTSTLTKAYAYASAETTPAIGFYLETLGAALLLIAGGGGLVLSGGRAQPGPDVVPGERDQLARGEPREPLGPTARARRMTGRRARRRRNGLVGLVASRAKRRSRSP